MTGIIEIALHGHVDESDRTTNEYVPLPFEVPSGFGRVDVRFSINQRISADQVGWQEGNIVDIGVFDPRGVDFLADDGFRGWSGSMRDEFFIAGDEATPGYLAGPIYSGTWHVVLGLYQLTPGGCDYEVSIALLPGQSEHSQIAEPHQPAPSPRVTRAEGRWYRGDLHAHTWHSDGTASLGDLTAAARTQGLDFIAVTEHNTISHLHLLAQETAPELLLIPGVEISTYHGHANVWPIDGFVEFRCQAEEQMDRVRRSLIPRGALFSINHPKDGGPPWEFGRLFDPDCIEVWGGPWFISNYQSLALWDRQLRKGKRITAVGGSDKHVGPYSGESGWYDVGTPCTWVYADDLSIPAIAEGIRTGQVFISATPEGPQLGLTASLAGSHLPDVGMGGQVSTRAGSTLHLECSVVSGSGSILRLISAFDTIEVRIMNDDYVGHWEVVVEENTYWRAEVIEPPEVPLAEEPAALMALALGNPIYVAVA